ncbi:hypothetical protein CI102_3362 [Trichoderma harzianum]|nr:hypothetical protein CI102_3362 [Trichoderma harzianum]
MAPSSPLRLQYSVQLRWEWKQEECTAVSKQEIGPGRARNNFRKLLKHFASDLRVETVNNHHRGLVGFVKTNLSNISQELFSEFFSNDQEAGDTMPESRMQQYAAESQKRIEEYLQLFQDPESVEHNNTNDQVELSESDGESDQDGADEEAEPDELHNDPLKHLGELRHFILDSTAYHTLRHRFDEFVRPSLRSKLGDLLTRWSRHDHRHHSFVARYKLSDLVAELQYIHPQEIRLDEDNKNTHWQAFLGYYQNLIEQWTQGPWDWWPLPHYPRLLGNGESRLRWQCVSLIPF